MPIFKHNDFLVYKTTDFKIKSHKNDPEPGYLAEKITVDDPINMTYNTTNINLTLLLGGENSLQVIDNKLYLKGDRDNITDSLIYSVDSSGQIGWHIFSFQFIPSRAINAGGYNNYYSLNNIEYFDIENKNNALEFGKLSFYTRNNITMSNGNEDRGIIGTGSIGYSYFNTLECINFLTPSNSAFFAEFQLTGEHMIGDINGTGNKALLGCGNNDSLLKDIYTFNCINNSNSELYCSLVNNLTNANSCYTLNNLIICGGYDGVNLIDTIKSINYTEFVDFSEIGNLSTARKDFTLCSNDTYGKCLLTGGSDNNSLYDTIEIFSIENFTTIDVIGNLASPKKLSASTSSGVKNTACVLGGSNNNILKIEVEYINLSSLSKYNIFSSLSSRKDSSSSASNSFL